MDGATRNMTFESVMELLEQILAEDPDFETQDEADFIEQIADSSPSYFRTSQAKQIIAIHSKYCGDRPVDSERACD